MKHLFLFLILACSLPANSQTAVGPTESEIHTIPGDTLKYEIIKRDTIVHHFTKGSHNEPRYQTWDSTAVRADFIFLNLPAEYDKSYLEQKILEIMAEEKINKAHAFRDRSSSMLFRMSSSYAYERMKEGYLGQFNSRNAYNHGARR